MCTVNGNKRVKQSENEVHNDNSNKPTATPLVMQMQLHLNVYWPLQWLQKGLPIEEKIIFSSHLNHFINI